MEIRTIELDGIVDEGLQGGTIRPHFLGKSSLASFLVHHNHDSHGRNTAAGQDDGESSECPSEVKVGVEKLTDAGAGKGGSNSGSSVDSENDHTVLESCHVGSHHVDDIQETDVTSPVENVCCDVGCDILGHCLHDHADQDDENHAEETLNTPPDINDLGGSERNTSS